jgi:hypothetical protein
VSVQKIITRSIIRLIKKTGIVTFVASPERFTTRQAIIALIVMGQYKK